MGNARYACIVLPTRVWLSAGFSEDAFFKFAESCGRFSSQIAIRPPEAIWIEIGRSRHLVREERLQLQVELLARRFGIAEVQVGIAGTATQAWIAAQYGVQDIAGEVDWRQVPVTALLDVLDPFQRLGEAARLDLQMQVAGWVESLDALGVQNLAEWLEIPHSEQLARFGESMLEALARCEGERDAVWPGWKTEEPICESWDASDIDVAEGSVSATPVTSAGGVEGDLDRLLFLLKPLMDRSLARLHGRMHRLSRARLRMECDRLAGGDPQLQWEWEFPFAPGSVTAILPILRERLSQEFARKPLTGAVRRMYWEILHSVPGRSAQMDGFTREMEEQAEQQSALWGRLSARLGEGSVFRWRAQATHLPEGQVREISPRDLVDVAELSATLPPEQPRPARLLRKPRKLSSEQLAEMQMTGTVMHGPERIVAEWWNGILPRDYYRLWTRSGRSLWVYREPSGEVFLHGYFD